LPLSLKSKMKNIKIKTLKLDKFNDFYQVFETSLLTDFNHFSKSQKQVFLNSVWRKNIFLKRFNRGFMVVFRASFNDKTRGYLIASLEPGGVSLLRWIWVDKKQRNKNMGTKLINFWQKWALKQKCHKLNVKAVAKNKGFYQKQGFVNEGVRKKDQFLKDYFLLRKVIK